MLSLMCCYALTPLEKMLFPDYKVFFLLTFLVLNFLIALTLVTGRSSFICKKH